MGRMAGSHSYTWAEQGVQTPVFVVFRAPTPHYCTVLPLWANRGTFLSFGWFPSGSSASIDYQESLQRGHCCGAGGNTSRNPWQPLPDPCALGSADFSSLLLQGDGFLGAAGHVHPSESAHSVPFSWNALPFPQVREILLISYSPI